MRKKKNQFLCDCHSGNLQYLLRYDEDVTLFAFGGEICFQSERVSRFWKHNEEFFDGLIVRSFVGNCEQKENFNTKSSKVVKRCKSHNGAAVV